MVVWDDGTQQRILNTGIVVSKWVDGSVNENGKEKSE